MTLEIHMISNSNFKRKFQYQVDESLLQDLKKLQIFIIESEYILHTLSVIDLGSGGVMGGCAVLTGYES